MKKYLLLLATLILTGCFENMLPEGALYRADPITERFNGILQWSQMEFDNKVFTCIDGYVYDRTDTSTTIQDVNLVDIECSPDITFFANIVKI